MILPVADDTSWNRTVIARPGRGPERASTPASRCHCCRRPLGRRESQQSAHHGVVARLQAETAGVRHKASQSGGALAARGQSPLRADQIALGKDQRRLVFDDDFRSGHPHAHTGHDKSQEPASNRDLRVRWRMKTCVNSSALRWFVRRWQATTMRPLAGPTGAGPRGQTVGPQTASRLPSTFPGTKPARQRIRDRHQRLAVASLAAEHLPQCQGATCLQIPGSLMQTGLVRSSRLERCRTSITAVQSVSLRAIPGLPDRLA